MCASSSDKSKASDEPGADSIEPYQLVVAFLSMRL